MALAIDKKKPPCRIECGFANHILRTGRFLFEVKESKAMDSLSHTTWRGQYHGVFAPKYRRMVIYGQIKQVRQVWKSAFLGQGIFCGHGREEQKENSRIHQKSAATGPDRRSVEP
jgi:hypothetical protein